MDDERFKPENRPILRRGAVKSGKDTKICAQVGRLIAAGKHDTWVEVHLQRCAKCRQKHLH